MIKKQITFTDLLGEQRTEDFYFHITKAELMDMELESGGSFSERVQKLVDAKDYTELVKLFKDFIIKAYGERTSDGRGFIKKPELTEAFVASEAFSELYLELASNTDAGAEFIKGIVPADVAAKAAEIEKENNAPKLTEASEN